ncbi:MAG: DUF5685 family protein [Oscillospiraceae bacterium]
MFGYIRPDAPELRIKEFERFRACYCGLCHELSERYGLTARFVLNYDFVFLAMLLSHDENSCDYCFKRCMPTFFRRRCVCSSSRQLEVCAGYCVILTYWKLCDTVNDEKGLKRLKARLLRTFLRRSYNKASADFSDFDSSVSSKLIELTELENANEPSMDKSADKFAALLASAAAEEPDEAVRRALEQILYHVGRIIYIADAYNDIKDDIKHKRYNPLVTRYSLTTLNVPKEVSLSVSQTLSASSSMMSAAFELLPRNYWSEITENIVYYGIPDMCRQVIAGTYSNRPQRLPKRPDKLQDRSEN